MHEQHGKIDFHLHSYASNVTGYYAANALAIPESYSDPRALHALLKKRGMTLVTLTDHNSIDGVKELLDAGKQDVFASAEMTATFPKDGCHIHVTVANVTETQFREVDRLRGNVFEMVAYLDQQIAAQAGRPGGNEIAYFMTHPLMSTGNRPYGREGALAVDHLEQAVLLFEAFEVRNGSRTKALNELTRRLLESLDRETIERLADKHGIAPKGDAPWRKALLAGSDDHAGINPGNTWTAFPVAGGRPVANDVIRAIRARRTQPCGAHGGPITLAHSLLKLLYDGSARAKQTRTLSVGGPIHGLFRMVFDEDRVRTHERLIFRGKAMLRGWLWRHLQAQRGAVQPFESLLESEVLRLIADPAFIGELAVIEKTDDRIFLVLNTLLNRIFARYVDGLTQAQGRNVVFIIKQVVTMISSNLFVSLPYLMSFAQQSSDSLVARDVRQRFGLGECPRVVLLTDTLFEINGVAASIKRMIREAIKRDKDFTVVTCLSADERARHAADPEIAGWLAAGRLKLFEPVAQLDFPEYNDFQIRVPPLLELMKYLQEEGFTKMQVSTPGIIGLAGLAAAKALQIETAATYHTSVPEYVENYTKDVMLEALAWQYMIVFYHSVDEVLVPSKYIARLLHKRGLRSRKLLILDRWVDVTRFHPGKRQVGYYATHHGLADEAALVKFVYVGRVAVEKNLQLIAQAYRRLRATHAGCHLIIVGDGPYRARLEAELAGVPVTFTGVLEGEQLPIAIASADAKLFPSTTDTWGNAPLEAQACGLPVVVSETGGPVELMEHGVTGLVVNGRDVESLHAAMVTLMDGATRERMGRQARQFIEDHRVDEPFTAVLDADGYRKRLDEEKARGKRVRGGVIDLTRFMESMESMESTESTPPIVPMVPGDARSQVA
jgi:glycosyltransferase involved in cell wall biosynthesis